MILMLRKRERERVVVSFCVLSEQKKIKTLNLEIENLTDKKNYSFSHGTMPLTNLFKNCSYYWGFAAFVSYFVNHPNYTSPPADRAVFLFALAILCQLCNARAHVILANLRPPGKSTGYAVPRGFPFDIPLVGGLTCANYTFEIYGWVLFALATKTVAGFLFIAAGAAQMALWAKAKHARLRKTFDGLEGRERYPKRYIMLPPFF